MNIVLLFYKDRRLTRNAEVCVSSCFWNSWAHFNAFISNTLLDEINFVLVQ